jgi:DNA mismatch repair protein MutS2
MRVHHKGIRAGNDTVCSFPAYLYEEVFTMQQRTLHMLEYEEVKKQLLTYAMSYLGKRQIAELQPIADVKRISRWLDEVQEGKRVLETGSSVPIPSLDGMELVMMRLKQGYILTESDVSDVSMFLQSLEKLRQYMLKKRDVAPQIASYALSTHELEGLREALEESVQHGQLRDEATPTLARIRKKLRVVNDRMRKKLDSVVKKYGSYMQERLVSQRADRNVIPIKRDYRSYVKGTVLDESASGQTLFIEPLEIAEIQQQVAGLKAEEEQERQRILSRLTQVIASHEHVVELNLEVIGYYDFLFAKAKYARTLRAEKVRLNDRGYIRLVNARHPLLTGECVPLNMELGASYQALIVTGPNTGGKTVTLKTVGLLTLMAQSGLLVPADPASELSVYEHVVADIGDGQSIEESLSTFSAHVKALIEILRAAGPRTLVLLDELASGTDPGEGIGLAIAVLESLQQQGSSIIATTHFNDIKKFADVTPGFENARMEFDVQTLHPLYRLRIGEAGESYAFAIASRLGMDAQIITRSKEISQKLAVSNARSEALAAVFTGAIAVQANHSNQQHKHKRKHKHKQNDRQEEANVTPLTGKDQVYQIGDRVWIHSMKRSAIVTAQPDAQGNLVVQVQGKQRAINHKRISPYLTREQLYPDNYDLDIVLKSKADRKKQKQMSKRHTEGLFIEHPDETKF